jgi:Na+-transporting methylmalonyl-CoA/oxaloacetate decarboxylase gamma subunit
MHWSCNHGHHILHWLTCIVFVTIVNLFPTCDALQCMHTLGILVLFLGAIFFFLVLSLLWVNIRCKPTFPWKLWKLQSEPHDVKLWKLQSEPHDVDPTERLEVGGVICKTTFANHPSHLLWILQITPPTSHEFSLGSKSCGLDWSFHSLHEEVGFHYICSPLL